MTSRPLLACLLTSTFALGCNVTVSDAESPTIAPEPSVPATDPGAPAASATPSVDPAARFAGKICTQMGCIDGFGVELSGKFGKGRYEIALEADGKKGTCELNLPLNACDKGHSVTCKGDLEVMIGESGCALPAEQHAFGPINFKGAAANLKIAVKRNGREIGKGEFKPTYQTIQPNGPDCPPTCNHANDKLELR